MRAFLRVTDAIEDTNPKIQTWVKKVREVAYDIEDLLDAFMLRFAHRIITNSVAQSKAQAPTWQTMEDGMIEEVMHFY
ncbi:hypothetical protein CsSME_00015858 [Camellia sinensis var. sinensis]